MCVCLNSRRGASDSSSTSRSPWRWFLRGTRTAALAAGEEQVQGAVEVVQRVLAVLSGVPMSTRLSSRLPAGTRASFVVPPIGTPASRASRYKSLAM